jgi:Fe-S-cluster containining protein
MSDRCTGQCCEEFALMMGTSAEEIDFKLRTFVHFDGEFIADMLIPLRPLIAGAKMPNGEIVTIEQAPDGPKGWVFTCKHFDRFSRSCAVYNNRPLMCRDFPYGKPCEHGSRCEWDKGRAGKHPPRFVLYEDGHDDNGKTTRRVHLAVIGGPS